MTTQQRLPWLILACFAVLTTVLYSIGLGGGYVFDDYPNIVNNPAIHVVHSSLAAWVGAMMSSPTGGIGRPMAALSFAINWYMTGGAPGPMKATNLGIHLLNGVLAFLVIRTLVRLYAKRFPQAMDAARGDWIAALTAGIWLLSPVNLTAVLYVVQREEALAQVFVLGGLLAYLGGRARMLEGRRGGLVMAIIGLVGGTALGVLAKETAIMLPAYAFLVEVFILGFRGKQTNDRLDTRLVGFYAISFVGVAMPAVAWLMARTLTASAWAERSFTVGQRLLTELRIVVWYLRECIVPDGMLSLYHDDIVVSTGWLHPASTLACGAGIAGLVVLIWALRRKAPLVSLGIAWFLAAHMLTGSFIPLELAYDHRNYFPDLGIWLAMISIWFGLKAGGRFMLTRLVMIGILVGWSGLVLGLRSYEWGNPLRLAIGEASRHPHSARANYEAGRLMVSISGYKPGLLLDSGRKLLERAAAAPGSSSLPIAGLILIDNHTGKPLDRTPWTRMIKRLKDQADGTEDISALDELERCRGQSAVCRFPIAWLDEAYQAMFLRGNTTAREWASYASFQIDLKRDVEGGTRSLGDAVRMAPSSPEYRYGLAQQYILLGRDDEAAVQIQALTKLNVGGKLDGEIATLHSMLAHKKLWAQLRAAGATVR